MSFNTIELELENSSNLKLDNLLDYTIKDNLLIVQSKEVNKDIIKIVTQVEKTTNIKNMNIINGSLEDAFIKLTK